jgi:hypothetical protein
MLKVEIEKKNQLEMEKKWSESTLVNLLNLWPDSWDWDKFIERKLKNNYEV